MRDSLKTIGINYLKFVHATILVIKFILRETSELLLNYKYVHLAKKYLLSVCVNKLNILLKIS